MDLIKTIKIAKEIGRHVVGLPPSEEVGEVREEIRDKRVSTCEKNLCGKFSAFTRRCGECGCFVDVKAKLIYEPNEPTKEVQCPLFFW